MKPDPLDMDVHHLDMILNFSWTCLCISAMCNVQCVFADCKDYKYIFELSLQNMMMSDKMCGLWRDSVLPPARPGQWFWGIVPPPPSSGGSYTWYIHLPNHTLGKHKIRPRQIWPVSPSLCVHQATSPLISGSRLLFQAETVCTQRACTPPLALTALTAQSECLPLIQCCFTWWSAFVCVMSIILIIYGLKIPSLGRSTRPQQNSVTSIRSGLSDVVEPEPEFQLFWSHHVLGCGCVCLGVHVWTCTYVCLCESVCLYSLLLLNSSYRYVPFNFFSYKHTYMFRIEHSLSLK